MSNVIKDSILIHSSLWHQVNLLTDEQSGSIFKAMLKYGLDGTLPEFSNLSLQLVWAAVKAQMDDNAEKYEAKRQKNRENIRKRWEKNTTVNGGTENVQTNTVVNNGINRIPNDMKCSDMKCSDMGSNTTFVSSDKSSEKKCVCEQDNTHTQAHTDFLRFQEMYKQVCPCLVASDLSQPNERGYTSMLSMVGGNVTKMWDILIDMNNKKETTEKYTSVTQTFKKFLQFQRK